MINQSIEIKVIDNQQHQAWDDYVLTHQEHTPYHFWGWGKAVTQGYGHKHLNIVALEQGKIVGVCSLVLMAKFGFSKSFCSLPFCDIGGALADSEQIKAQILTFAQALAKDHNCQNLDIREQGLQVTDPKHLAGKKVSMILSLPETADELMASFKSKLRSQIRKSEKNGLTYEFGTGHRFVEGFYQVFSVNMHRLGSPVHSLKWFTSVAENYVDRHQIVLVKKDEHVIGAGFILFSGSKVSIPWASTLAEFNRLAPNMMVYWALLKFSCDHGCKYFDFGRSTFGEGTFKFKQQWGAQPQALQWYNLLDGQATSDEESASSGPSTIRTLVEKIWRAMPLSLANMLGPILRKHISL